jgi:hypothetical protein
MYRMATTALGLKLSAKLHATIDDATWGGFNLCDRMSSRMTHRDNRVNKGERNGKEVATSA